MSSDGKRVWKPFIFGKEGDGWFATPELDKAICRRVTRAGKR